VAHRLGLFRGLGGQIAAMPWPAPRRAAISGQMPQAGDFGVQIVAPRSISACAWQPGRTSGVRRAASAFSSGLDLGSGVVSTAKRRDITRSILPSSTGAGRSKAMEAMAAAV
jgi:hypothetical protein